MQVKLILPGLNHVFLVKVKATFDCNYCIIFCFFLPSFFNVQKKKLKIEDENNDLWAQLPSKLDDISSFWLIKFPDLTGFCKTDLY